MANSDTIHLIFFNESILVNASFIRIVDFKNTLTNVKNEDIIICLIQDENDNNGIAVLRGLTVKKINNGILWKDDDCICTFQMIDDFSYNKDAFSPSTTKKVKKEEVYPSVKKEARTKQPSVKNVNMQERPSAVKNVNMQEPPVKKVKMQKESAVEKLKKHLESNYESIKEIYRIGDDSSNGFINVITNTDGTKKILKSSRKTYSDNLFYEYMAGLYVNKLAEHFPCFIKTEGLFHYNNKTDWWRMKNKSREQGENQSHTIESETNINSYLTEIHTSTSISKINSSQLELAKYLKIACEKSELLAISLEHIDSTKSLYDLLYTINDSDDLLFLLYQIYMPLSILSEHFTHHDLHYGNVMIIKTPNNTYYDYEYELKDGTIITFKSPYMAKIIDYGRCFFEDADDGNSSKKIYETICYVRECLSSTSTSYWIPSLLYNTCGKDFGFLHKEFATKNSKCHDLRLLSFISDKLRYMNSPLLTEKGELTQLAILFQRLLYKDDNTYFPPICTDEKLSHYILVSLGLYNKDKKYIYNVKDAHNVIKTFISSEKSKNNNFDKYKDQKSIGTYRIFEDLRRPYKFDPK